MADHHPDFPSRPNWACGCRPSRVNGAFSMRKTDEIVAANSPRMPGWDDSGKRGGGPLLQVEHRPFSLAQLRLGVFGVFLGSFE
jgi:hypothetical protein